jgi:phage terminase large subunit-like protein
LDYVKDNLAIPATDRSLELTDPVDWIQANFYIPETNAPIQLVPYQQAVVREALRTDDNGLFVYSFVLWSDIKKSAKSTIAGAISLYLAWFHAWESVRIVANDLRQADSRTFFYIERAIKLHPILRKSCKVKTYHIELPNHTILEAIPVDPKGEAGGGDLCTTFTEVWAMKNRASQQLFTETTLSPLKYGKSLRIGESYAGFRGESPILEPLYETGVKQGEKIDLSFGGVDLKDLEVYRNKRMLTLWNKTPRCPWQTPAYYEQEASVLTPSEMERIHANSWADALDGFVAIEWWIACKTEYAIEANEPVIMGVDAATSSDCFAITLVSKRGKDVFVHYVNIWTPPKGGTIDFRQPELEIRRLINQYNVIEIAFDNYQLHSLMQRIRDEEVVNVRAFPQGGDRLLSDKRLYDLIRDRAIHHHGEAVLMDHIGNAAAAIDKEDGKLRIVKRQQDKKIDAAVALAMSSHRLFAYAID